MVFLRSAISTIYEPSIKSIIMDSARSKTREKMGSFAGLQQSMKGMAQVRGGKVKVCLSEPADWMV